jgi:hypothetical protein
MYVFACVEKADETQTKRFRNPYNETNTKEQSIRTYTDKNEAVHYICRYISQSTIGHTPSQTRFVATASMWVLLCAKGKLAVSPKKLVSGFSCTTPPSLYPTSRTKQSKIGLANGTFCCIRESQYI